MTFEEIVGTLIAIVLLVGVYYGGYMMGLVDMGKKAKREGWINPKTGENLSDEEVE